MWSSNLLLASLQKLNREKRKRQPNWTESEKEFLLRLTEMHKSILENKGSDTMTIKRKSEVWDEIALRMKSAGFNRSKERLKQQLGRIRAAEAKRVKDSLVQDTIDDEIKILNNSSASDEENLTHNYACSSATPITLQENQCIKAESASLIDCMVEKIEPNPSTFVKPNIINYAIVNSGKENKNSGNPKIVLDGMHLTLKSVHSQAAPNKSVETESKINSRFNEQTDICATDDTSSSIPCSNKTSNTQSPTSIGSHHNNNNANIKTTTSPITAGNSRIQQQRKRRIQSRSNNKHSTFNREQSLRQLYTYRISFERERLRNLKLQQKRDRILYRKDVEIQNLKLEILKNVANQQCDANNCV